MRSTGSRGGSLPARTRPDRAPPSPGAHGPPHARQSADPAPDGPFGAPAAHATSPVPGLDSSQTRRPGAGAAAGPPRGGCRRGAGAASRSGRGDRRDAGLVHRLRLRHLRGPQPAADGRLARALAVLGGRHLHRRGEPGLPPPAPPRRGLGGRPVGTGLAAAAVERRASGTLQREHPLVEDRPVARPRVRRCPGPGPRRGHRRSGSRAGPGHRPGQHAVARHGGVRHLPRPVPRRDAGLRLVVDANAARQRIPLGLLLQRRLRHPDARAGPRCLPGQG